MLVGRSANAGLRLDDRQVSGEHATIGWTGLRWELRDLGSRNGTWADGRRLQPGEAVGLHAGSRVAFGREDDPWVLEDEGAPTAVAEAIGSGEVRTAEQGVLVLPDDEHPEVVLSADATGRWWLEQGDTSRAVTGDVVVTTGAIAWRVSPPEPDDHTAGVVVSRVLDAVTLRFGVSRDEEHVRVTVVCRGEDIVLEEREHWYTLLTLARLRLKDAAEPSAEQGWIERDDLLRMLNLDSNGLNVAIYRARRQLQAAGIDGAAALVEVRRGQRRIGMSTDRLEIASL